ncbi:MAG: tetratricopeptide repeat protein, partial [candidate division Zixibacteria bacterium]|nr:tetratricopeptide repeat protein [candidate division Zixibacteria bacterium]
WVLVNAQHQRSLNRYLLIQENDPHPIDEVGYKPYKIARLLSLAGLTGEMKHVYQRAIERNPLDTLSYYNLANWYEREGDLDQAMVILDTLIKIDPVYPLAHWLIGSIYIDKEDHAKALTYLEKALPSLEDNVDFLHHLWVANYSANRPERAVVCAQQMIKLRPDYLEAYNLLGLGYAGTGAFEKAREAWEHVLSINPEDSTAIQNLQKLEKHLKN